MEKNNNSFIPYIFGIYTPLGEPKYDDIVDKSDFKRVNETERISRLSSVDTGNGGAGLYDFNGSVEIDKKRDSITAITMALRSGKLDRADVDTLKRSLEQSANDEASELAKAELDKAEDKKSKKRQEALDKALGVDSAE